MKKIIKAIILALGFNMIAISANPLDYPHDGVNNISCNSCHFVFGTEPTLLPPWTNHVPQDIDDTRYNSLCRSCHTGTGGGALLVGTHSSLQTDNSYGDWSVECRTCHNPHYQKQFRTYGSSSYLYQAAVSDVTAATLTDSGANWTDDQYKGLVVVPNISKKDYNYKITGNTNNTLTVDVPINLTQVSVGNTFVIIYGKLVKEIIPTPNSGDKTVRFFNSTGTNSFAEGNTTYDGVCEVCHTMTNHFRNNGTGPDQLHSNMNYPAGTNCVNCHKHVTGFRGMGGGAHTTHVTEGYGPQLQCADCHGSNTPPMLADGQYLPTTTVCANCHSAGSITTAKSYWVIAGSSKGTPGSWGGVESEASFCGSCHDSTPGNTKRDGTGNNAPNVMGNNTTYGYSVTGHGRPAGFDKFANLSFQQDARVVPSDFIITDVNDDNPAGPQQDKVITQVQHIAGAQTATMSINVNLISADIGADTITPVGTQIFDSAGNAMGTNPIVIRNTDTTPPAITKVEGKVGSNQIMVYFSEPVYTNSGATGALVTSDLTLTDSDNGRTIISIAHLAGDPQARLTLSSNLGSASDLGVDTLAAAASQIYDSSGNVMGTSAVVINDPSSDTTAPAITKVTGSAGSNQLTLYFNEPVYSNVNTFDGNPAANRQCSACHNLTSQHFNTVTKRLRTGYENDSNNSNCKQCHDPASVAIATPQWYTTYADYQNSAHNSKKCSVCHDVHGAKGAFPGMTNLNQESLCSQSSCHSGIGGHTGVGTAMFSHTGKDYTLECISCHNVHIVTGTYAQADQNKSPVTKFTDNTHIWGDDSNEKMNSYAGSGTYRTPNGESFTGAQLPDYPSFCLDCHGTGGVNHTDYEPSPYFRITWDGDAHGRQSANEPNGYGVCPNWPTCGEAFGRSADDCTGTQAQCWPVIPRGAGDELFSRPTYTHTERIAGANFVLSCTDCHTGHGSGVMGRPNVNGGSFSTTWNSMCNNCHWYYSDWHDEDQAPGGRGMGCGTASCHEQNSPHRNKKVTGSGAVRTFNPDLVLDMRFEGDWKDSGGWQMDGQWYSTAGQFTTGKSGQSILFGEDVGVQVGTENSHWSTDDGWHGTWKYTEMKYNTSLEAWVNPTDNAKSEYTIFHKHVGVSNNGSYSFTLKKINGTLRAAFNMAADNNGFAQDGRAGVRGAYSSVAVPLSKWTHIAATFDTSGPDSNPSDPTVGRIRIYVNGEDVTTSDSSGSNMQPGVNENSIYAFSENSGWNEVGVCYADSWCASEFVIGGFDYEATNYIGRIDEAKVWNVTKDASYFAQLDSQTAPYISEVKGLIGNNQLTVAFSEGVYTNTGSSGALTAADFTLTDTGGNNPRTITGVSHTAGSTAAVITMSQPLTANDVDSDTLAAATASSIYDNYNNAMGTDTVTIGLSSQCPTSPVNIQLNEGAGSAYVMDTQGVLYGAISGGSSAFPGDGYFHGNGSSAYYLDFSYNTSCLLASTAMTLEARIEPTGLAGAGAYLRRVIERNAGSANYQLSVWRNNGAAGFNYNAPGGEASIALWVAVADNHGGDTWKPVLTNYTGAANGSENNCPIVSDHWYQVKAVWNTNRPGGTPGQFFQPADIYIDDQGTDGYGAGENWAGYINCTDTDQSLKGDIKKFYTNDQINTGSGLFRIGSSISGGNLFNGLIDWITWKDSVN